MKEPKVSACSWQSPSPPRLSWSASLPFLAGLVLLTLVGCGRPERTYVRPADQVLINERGESVPVKIRLYQLKFKERFMQTEFTELWMKDDALGDDRLADPVELIVRARTDEDADDLEIELPPWHEDARYLGVMVLNPHVPSRGQRRGVIALNEVDDFVIRLDDGMVEVLDR